MRRRMNMGWRAILAVALAALVPLVSVACGGADGTASPGADPVDPLSRLAWVDLADLPNEARETLRTIERGGPYRYARDGSVFANREGVLPERPRGEYREYTVPTPGSADRGARRIVAADGLDQLYYTSDHYSTFRRIRR